VPPPHRDDVRHPADSERGLPVFIDNHLARQRVWLSRAPDGDDDVRMITTTGAAARPCRPVDPNPPRRRRCPQQPAASSRSWRYVVHRYYDPTTGQFLSRDPLVAVTGSPYHYVNGNPLNGSDPAGLGDDPSTCAGYFDYQLWRCYPAPPGPPTEQNSAAGNGVSDQATYLQTSGYDQDPRHGTNQGFDPGGHGFNLVAAISVGLFVLTITLAITAPETTGGLGALNTGLQAVTAASVGAIGSRNAACAAATGAGKSLAGSAVSHAVDSPLIQIVLSLAT